MLSNITKQTILKHDRPGPRYTSYPTAPEWSNELTPEIYQKKLKAFGQTEKTLSLYIHVPFCQSLCYFCACNVVIRKQETKYGDEYIDYVSKEMDLVSSAIGSRKTIRQFHLGGGTPTFLNEEQLGKLFKKVQDHFDIDLNGEIAIEIDPRTIDLGKVKQLKELGFNRVSMGIQDFAEDVQKNINRVQPFEKVKAFYDYCRELEFHSVNFDLIYGLPGQTPAEFAQTVQQVIALRPDRIALYSFAYVPWLKKHQQKFAPKDLPSNDQKLDIFLQSRQRFLDAGYQAIAMDHFALKTDELSESFNQGVLYRNFMGYTVKPADEFIGFGMTAIGFLENAFIQNHKTLPEYYAALEAQQLPIERGKNLTRDDQIRQWVINSLMCRFVIDKILFQEKFQEDFDNYFLKEQTHILHCVEEGLLELAGDQVCVTDLGKIFIRNICMGFDWYLRQKNAHQKFSRTV